MTYKQLKQKREATYSEFTGIFYAFSDEQFLDGLAKVGLCSDSLGSLDKLCSIGAGGYLLKSKKDDYRKMLADIDTEFKEFLAIKPNLLEALIYELHNIEYAYTYDPTDAVEALGLTLEAVDSDILKEATETVLSQSW